METDITDELNNVNGGCCPDLAIAARNEIIRLREKCDKQARILQHVFPENSGRYFISGQCGEVDRNGLPEAVSICPAYGVGWTVTYKRIS